MHNTTRLSEQDPRKQTMNPHYRICPESLYRAIEELSTCLIQPLSQLRKKAIPIYVTENGIAPINDDDETRTQFYQKNLYVLARAIKDGHDVRGYITWSFMDNYEWGSFGEKRYGLFHVDFDNPSLPRTFKPGAQYLCDVIKEFRQ
jgi:beta-glucosidase/6-phospho-beta-glucosidase/beta-galactosidase